MRFNAAAKAEIERIVTKRLARDRQQQSAALQALRDENTQLRTELEQVRLPEQHRFSARLWRWLRGRIGA